MINIIKHYSHWLHGKWPDREIEKQPMVNADGTTNVKGCYIVGDLTGIPLLKFSSDTGTKAVHSIINEDTFNIRKVVKDVHDIIIIGGGVSGYAAAIEAKKQQVSFKILESNQPFSTIANFPNKKPIYTYPSNMTPEGELQFSSNVTHKESLLAELKAHIAQQEITAEIAQVSHIKRQGKIIDVVLENGETLLAHRVIIAIGRSGNFRKIKCRG